MARLERVGWGFVNAANHRLAAGQRGWTDLRVHWYSVIRKALHGVTRPSGQVVSHGKVHGTVEIKKKKCKKKYSSNNHKDTGMRRL